MDFALKSKFGKPKCPKCKGTNITTISTKGQSFLACSCGWKKQILKNYPRNDIDTNTIQKS